jgi:hypothetical protein
MSSWSLVPFLQQSPQHVPADKAGCAGEKDFHEDDSKIDFQISSAPSLPLRFKGFVQRKPAFEISDKM